MAKVTNYNSNHHTNNDIFQSSDNIELSQSFYNTIVYEYNNSYSNTKLNEYICSYTTYNIYFELKNIFNRSFTVNLTLDNSTNYPERSSGSNIIAIKDLENNSSKYQYKSKENKEIFNIDNFLISDWKPNDITIPILKKEEHIMKVWMISKMIFHPIHHIRLP